MEIKFMSFLQPIGRVHITYINGKILDKICKADIRRINKHDDYIGIERELIKNRLNEIGSYINTIYAAFPNNVVLNIDTNNESVNIDYERNILSFELKDDIFEILDGQHRIISFSKAKEDFEIPVAFYVNLDDSSKAIIFNNINFEQRPVSSSLSFELETLFPVYTPEKMLRNIVEKLNRNMNSPYYRRIKMRGVSDASHDDGVISLNSFVSVMILKTYTKSKKHVLRDYLLRSGRNNFDINLDKEFTDKLHTKNHYLWNYYFYKEEDALFSILLNFFNAIKRIFQKDWNSNSLLMKAVGFKALFGLFESLYYKGRIDKNFTESYFYEKLLPLKEIDGKVNSVYYGSSFSEASKIEKLFRSKL